MNRSSAGVLPHVVATLVLGVCSALVGAQDYTHPKSMALPPPAFERPDPGELRMVLDNGITAYVAEDHRAPMATLTVYIGAGSGHGAAGAAEAWAAALRRGPAGLAPGAFSEQLDALYAIYGIEVGHEETTLTLDLPAEHARKGLDLVARTLAAPDFHGDRALPSPGAGRAVAGGIDYGYTLARAIARFEDALFRGHAFRRSAPSAAEALAGARSLHAQALRGANIALAYAGDFSAQQARQDLRDTFSALPSGEFSGAGRAFAPLPAADGRTLLLEDVPRDQGWVVIGHELPVVPLADEAALAVADYILGAYHLDSRLYRNSRERRGLTNDSSSFLEAGVNGPGAYSIRTYGRPEAVRLLVAIGFRELERLRSSLPTQDELFVARGALVDGLYAQRYATGTAAAQSYALEWLRHGDHDRSASYPGRIAAVTRDDVRAAAKKYLHPERMIVSVVGPLERIAAAGAIEDEPQLEAWGATPGR